MDVVGWLSGGLVAVALSIAAVVIVLVRPSGPIPDALGGTRAMAVLMLGGITILTLAMMFPVLLVAVDDGGSPPMAALGAGMAVGICSLAIAGLWLHAVADAVGRPARAGRSQATTLVLMMLATFVATLGVSAVLLATFAAE